MVNMNKKFCGKKQRNKIGRFLVGNEEDFKEDCM